VAISRVLLAVTPILLSFAAISGVNAQDATPPSPSCSSSITVLMNSYGDTRIATGSTIWFSAVLEGIAGDAGALGTAPIRIDVRQSRITFGNWRYVIAMPDSTITLDPSTREPERWWVGNSAWSLTYAARQIPEAFFDGMPFTAPEPFIPAYSGPVTWAATFTASRPGITLRWAWSAAVYSRFGENGRLLVKPLTAPVSAFGNGDPAGTPELYKQYVVAGAMGAGAPQYTGARSTPESVTACPLATAPPPTRALRTQPRMNIVTVHILSFGERRFASPISQRLQLTDGTVGQSVDHCFTTDLCALIQYPSGEQLAIYSEGAASCKPYVVRFVRTSFNRAIYGFSRALDYDRPRGSRCIHTRSTHIAIDGGRIRLVISKNADGTLRFSLAQ
jgi:hypothetical protein